MSYRIEKISIKNFRSISKLDIENQSGLLVICGANNVGKTNFLRALKLFFESDESSFSPSDGLPYHIYLGTRGGGAKSTIKLQFIEDTTNEKVIIEKIYVEKEGVRRLETKGTKSSVELNEGEIQEFISGFHFFFVEANNIDLPKLISSIVNDEILPIGLNRRRSATQKDSLQKLEEFIELSKRAVTKIESDITRILKDFLQNVELIDTRDWKLKILFPEYQYLRDAISNMIKFTLIDSNDKELDAKGSGIQRMVLLSLINYIKQKSRKEVIWAIDEPEAFLQPGLQKGLFKELRDIAEDNQIILSTHSHFFVNVSDLKNTYLLLGKKDLREYQRKPGMIFVRLNTERLSGSESEITQAIKNHLGIERNDSWEIQPFNLVVEGREDRNFFSSVLKACDLDLPNIIEGEGVDKYPGLLTWINDYCSELSFKPKVRALFDNDSAGRQKYNSLKSKIYPNFEFEAVLIRKYDGTICDGTELEDFVIPEILYPALNKVLRKQGYNTIRKADQNKRNLPAYKTMPILTLITELVRQINEDKNELDFNNQGLKYILSENIVKEIERNSKIKDEVKKYPRVLEFLKAIIKH